MSLSIVVDMNLSPRWVRVFEKHGIKAIHWSSVGNPNAKDEEIAEWARMHDYIVFTHDLDFGTMLALTRTSRPSIILPSRTENIT